MPSFVSIIIPVYNCEQFVAEAIKSALEQDYLHKEVILVNDGSTDGTLEVLRTFGDAIRLIDQKNGGPPKARNTGLHAARGDYIAFLDADDVWLQNKISTQVAHLDAHPEVGTVVSSWYEWPAAPNGKYIRPDFSVEPMPKIGLDERYSGWLYNKLLFDCVLLTSAVMMRSSIVKLIGDFDVTMFNGDDYDYWIRVSRVAQISRLRKVGTLYRVLPGSVSRKPRAANSEHIVIQKALAKWGLTGPDGTKADNLAMQKRLRDLLVNHAYDHLHKGDPNLALAGFKQVLKANPIGLKYWKYVVQAWIKVRIFQRKKVQRSY
jgi:glycosyltransferase involved in cell wall biosynthesis